jgi:DNA-binding HxlR family transcriptional regulator
VLTALDEEPGLSNADLARRAFVTPQTMNQVLRELEQRHWVTRHAHPGHGRILQADLTHDGRQALRDCHQAADAVEEQMLWPSLVPPPASSWPQHCAPASRGFRNDHPAPVIPPRLIQRHETTG